MESLELPANILVDHHDLDVCYAQLWIYSHVCGTVVV